MSKKDAYYEKIKELINKKIGEWKTDLIKKEYVISLLIEEAHKQLSYYRQRKEDLIARMATDWPDWGCGLEFYTFFIQPLLKNPLLLHFINLSDNISLSDYKIKYGYVNSGRLNWVNLKLELSIDQNNKVTIKPDLVDIAISFLGEIDENIGLKDKIKLIADNLKTFLVRVRDADIGVQAFFSLFEGIIRNSAKHNKSKEDFEVRIVFCEDYKKLKSLFDTNGVETIEDLNDDRYSFVIISGKRDLCKGNGQAKKVDEKPIIQFLNDSLNEPIIDDTGNITPGKWGMKEIKICSCFLSGEKLERTNDTSINYVKVVKCPDKLWNDGNDGNKRFCYVIKLEKPRYVLAVLPERELPKDKVKKEWLKYGVKIIKEDEIENTNLDYDFLWLPQIDKNKKKFIEKNKHRLPQRIVDNNNIGNLINSNIDLQKFNELISFAYIKFFERYLNRFNNDKKWEILVYFEDDNVAGKWQNWWQNKSIVKKDINNLKCSFPKKSEDWESEYILNTNHNFKIAILRHRKISTSASYNRLDSNKKPKFSYYRQYASYSDPFISFLMNINLNEIGNLVFCQLLESTLLNILVIDERIAQVLKDSKAPDEPDVNLDAKLYWMGIYVAKKVLQDNEYVKLNNNDTKMVDINFDNIVNNSNGGNFCIEDNIPVDILLIHATRLKVIYENYKNKYHTVEDFINAIRMKIPYVIVHSGRGKTKGDIPSNAPFLEYSIVQKYILQEPSKFYLIQIALSAKGGN